jgi:hypothetical protein
VSAKITVRELDGTEYQLKAKLGKMVVKSGYAESRGRGLIVMVAVSLAYALRIITLSAKDFDRGKLNAEGLPQCTLAAYPVRDQTTQRPQFGTRQDWNRFPVQLA